MSCAVYLKSVWALVPVGVRVPPPAPSCPVSVQYMIHVNQTKTFTPVAFALPGHVFPHQRVAEPKRHAPQEHRTTPARSLLIARACFSFLGPACCSRRCCSGPAHAAKVLVFCRRLDISALVQTLLNKGSSVVCLGLVFMGLL